MIFEKKKSTDFAQLMYEKKYSEPGTEVLLQNVLQNSLICTRLKFLVKPLRKCSQEIKDAQAQASLLRGCP